MSHSKLLQAACIGVLLFVILPKVVRSNKYVCTSDDCTVEDGEDELYLVPRTEEQEASVPNAGIALRERPLVIISTLDGLISALDPEDGSIVWKKETGPGPLLSSSISQIELVSNGKWARLIPSLDGGLYKFDGDSIDAVPVTAESLLKSSFRLNEDLLISGGRESRIYGIESLSGRTKYTCGMGGCDYSQDETVSTDGLLVIKRSTQTVRAVEPRTGMERWNFSVGQHEIQFLDNRHDQIPCALDETSLDPGLKIVVPDGLVYGYSPQNPTTLTWKHKFKSPVAHAWVLNNGHLRQLDLLSPEFVPSLLAGETEVKVPKPVMYVGMHKAMLYVQESQNLRSDVSKAVQSLPELSASRPNFPRVEWKPFLATAHTRTPAINFEKLEVVVADIDSCSNDSSAPLETSLTSHLAGHFWKAHPHDLGVYLFESQSANSSDKDEFPEDSFEDYEDYWYNGEEVYFVPIRTFSYFWKEVLVSCMICSIVVHLIYTRGIERRLRFEYGQNINRYVMATIPLIVSKFMQMERRRRVSEPPNPQQESPNPADENGNSPTGKKSDMATSVSIPSTPTDPSVCPPSSSDTLRSVSTSSSDEYKSRYLTDFATVSCLGRGGFGVVFEAKNQVDECSYAVKRIRLPNRPEAREKVMREVKALAKLDHSNIVRYFNAWLETPPVGWQETHDACWTQSEVSDHLHLEESRTGMSLSLLPSNPHPFAATKGPNPFRLEEISDAVRDISFPVNSFSDGSDYVVFEANSIRDSCDGVRRSDKCNSRMNNQSRTESGLWMNSNVRSRTNCELRSNSDFSEESREEWDDSGSFDPAAKDFSVQISSGRSSDSSASNSAGSWDSAKKKKMILPLYNENRCAVNEEPTEASKSWNDFSIFQQDIMPRANPANHVAEMRSYYAYHAPEHATAEGPKLFLYIQMQLCKKESLREWLRTHQTHRDPYQVCWMFNQILQAVEYVHMQGMIHRDLKPSNIFFSPDGQIKVGDFGLVTAMAEEEEAQTPTEAVKYNPMLRHTDKVGTQLYMSPEQIAGKPYNHKVDIYSLGLIFFELLCPFTTQMEQVRTLMDLKGFLFPAEFEKSHPQEMTLLKIMLSHNPDERPTTIGIRARPPMVNLQDANIHDFPEYMHFALQRQRSSTRTASSSSS